MKTLTLIVAILVLSGCSKWQTVYIGTAVLKANVANHPSVRSIRGVFYSEEKCLASLARLHDYTDIVCWKETIE